jgi:hypothetical protein
MVNNEDFVALNSRISDLETKVEVLIATSMFMSTGGIELSDTLKEVVTRLEKLEEMHTPENIVTLESLFKFGKDEN